ncbi:type II toxin-antitoxin system VapC family toxin [Nitrosococcus wardiae]|uniref:PIN domain-containing protein n=1 Tax=Nitrosococcus wardiae TaxID=1814290 RepID=A0A4P7BVK7_9GAMM|nr:type II toxin-antitoxin system VapC family toxin [Nitrosococcus wardiae]QBQ53114.1 PIN domain-containing protein [Nitrosococcus wardiae]
MIVADTNVISSLLLPTLFSDSVDTLYRIDPVWAAPSLWKSEFKNVLTLYLRKGLITLEKALRLQENAELMMINNEFDVPSPHILALVNESKCSSYDCEFVALAHQLNTPLITQDNKLLKEFPSIAISISEFLDRKS